jgi:aminopeptidase-like protein
VGQQLYAFAAEIYPICRSITGPGVRQTLDAVERILPLIRTETPTGVQVLDWTVPPEWSIRDAFIKNAAGDRVVDFRAHNLHVVSYSSPVRERMPLSALKPHIFTLPDQPDAIPYRTTYYKESWGFCMTHRALEALPDGDYDVCIDSALEPGSLTYAEYVHQGETEDEVLLATPICHPSLANDNCSGIALLAHLGAGLAQLRTRYTYRLLFAPGTIGAIVWLARNPEAVRRIRQGLVLTGLGDRGAPTYKRTLKGDALVDRAMEHVLSSRAGARTVDFSPYGYDERQYNSPGFRLNVGLLQRSLFATFPEYHTSADNLDFITPESLEDSLRIVAEWIEVLERGDRRFVNTAPYGEPQLGKRGLYAGVGGDKSAYAQNMAMLWLLTLSDGAHTLLDIAERAKTPFAVIAGAAERLRESGLLKPAEG